MTLTLVSSSKIKVTKTIQQKSKFGQLIQQAGELQQQHKLLEQQLKQFRIKCTAYLEEHKLDQIISGDFRVSRVTRNKFTYSNRLQLEMQKVAISQEDEKAQALRGEGLASNNPEVGCSLSIIKNIISHSS